MRDKTLASMLAIGMMATFFTSCRGRTKKESVNLPEITAPEASRQIAGTILTVPEDMLVVINKVSDFNKWKTGYESHDTARLKNGLHNYFIGRGLYDSNTVVVVLKADDMKKAKTFASGTDLKKLMQAAGVTGIPDFHFMIAVWQDTAKIGYPLSLNTFTIKDWDKWRNAFDEGIQERDNNGLLARIMARDYETDKKVVLITALSDTSKAFQYYKSDALRKRREAGGVKGEPVRFIFRIVHQYS